MSRSAALALLLLTAGCASAPPGPETDVRAALGIGSNPDQEVAGAFDASADAAADVDAALARAKDRNTKVLLVMGGDWCPDSRGLAWRLEQPEVAPLVADGYELVFVDVGFRDRNLDIAQRYGVELHGTPTVLVLSPEGELLNPESVESWRDASRRRTQEVASYLQRWAPDAGSP